MFLQLRAGFPSAGAAPGACLRRLLVLLVAAGLAGGAAVPCHAGQRPVDATGRYLDADLASTDNEPPAAIFRTSPPADEHDQIWGVSPLTVTFNLCRSRDADVDDDLKFTFDFEGDGVVDFRGSCRASAVYSTGRRNQRCDWRPEVCVSDRNRIDGHRICRSYEVCVVGDALGVNRRRATIDFEDLPMFFTDLPAASPYQGFDWGAAEGVGGPATLANLNGAGYPTCAGYRTMGTGLVFNAFEARRSWLTTTDGSLVNFVSLDLVAAWETGVVYRIDGLVGGPSGTVVASTTATLTNTAVSHVALGFVEVDTLRLTLVSPGTNTGCSGNGSHFGLDNIVVER